MDQDQLVTLKLNELRKSIISTIDEGKTAMKTLAFISENYPVDTNFELIGKEILESNPKIDVIQLLDSGKIIAVYPIHGNESVLGYDILSDTVTKSEALEAIRRRDVYFAGPIDLKQGGRGLVGRFPIFKGGQFKGFSACIIFQNSLVSSLQLDQENDLFYYQLDKFNPNTGKRDYLLPLPDEKKEILGQKAETTIEEGGLTLSVQYIDSPISSRLITQAIIQGLFSILLGFFAWNFARQPAHLAKKVEEQSKALKESNQRYEYATIATSDVIWDWDLKTGHIYRSSQFYKMLGFKPDEYTGIVDVFRSRIHPQDREEAVNELNETIAGEKSYWENEFRIQNGEGEYIYVIDKGHILRDKNGKAIRMIGATQDITKRKNTELALKKEKDRLNYVIDGTQAGTWEWNVQTGETVFNESWAKIIGYTLDEIQPVSIDTWIKFSHPEDLKKSNEELKLYFEGKKDRYEAEVRMKHKNGSWRWVLDRGRAFSWTEDGKPLMMFGTHLDITHIKTQEEEIQKTNQKLLAANEELKVFASLASHDMKEPLRMISSFLSLLKKKYQEVLDAKGNQFIDFAVDGSKRLTALIDNLLEYSKIGFDLNLAENINTKKLLDEILELKKQVILEIGAEITIGDLPNIRGVKTPIQSLFQNLISNALKFRQKGKVPKIVINGHETENFWEFSVSDNGIGIESEYIDKIFEILVKLHSKDEYSGTGLGLAMCKKIVNQHGGNIWVESTPGLGSKFNFSIKKNGI
ncbi:PAS domain-containing protein [Algoriphagus sp. CAU 1675]|uniref:PAS domain-containing protein n=1 Tax=Algoriphagus sp. CAU 1675 TaxID=3032597 RepID=UPI0023DBC606|nr:PAS domain-containing protein [Algoriphagus sp. CAU 1675]MDF2157061.1 PAS domain-containing protein [Algoriphagus sp. CAU 1675]